MEDLNCIDNIQSGTHKRPTISIMHLNIKRICHMMLRDAISDVCTKRVGIISYVTGFVMKMYRCK